MRARGTHVDRDDGGDHESHKEERWVTELERNSRTWTRALGRGVRFLHNAGEDRMVRQVHGATRLAATPPVLTSTPHVGTLPHSIGSGSPPRLGSTDY